MEFGSGLKTGGLPGLSGSDPDNPLLRYSLFGGDLQRLLETEWRRGEFGSRRPRWIRPGRDSGGSRFGAVRVLFRADWAGGRI